MTEAICAPITAGVAGKATEKLIEFLEETDNPEQAWERAGLEVAIQSQAFYRQNLENGKHYKTDQVKKELQEYGEVAQQLAIRGDHRGFDSEKVDLLEDFGYSCASLLDQPFSAGMNLEEQFEEGLLEDIEQIKEQFETKT